MPCGKESSPRIAIGRKLLTEDPSCEAEDMTAPETFTAASKRPLTTGRRPDMSAICAQRTAGIDRVEVWRGDVRLSMALSGVRFGPPV
jgi:hypothetical protein